MQNRRSELQLCIDSTVTVDAQQLKSIPNSIFLIMLMVISGNNFLIEEKRQARRDTWADGYTDKRMHGHPDTWKRRYTDAYRYGHHCHSHPKGRNSLTLTHYTMYSCLLILAHSGFIREQPTIPNVLQKKEVIIEKFHKLRTLL